MDLRQVVRQRVLVPSFAGSNPAGPANLNFKIDPYGPIFYSSISPHKIYLTDYCSLFLHKVRVHRHL